MLLDIAQRTGTHNVTNGTANGRTMIATSGVTTNADDNGAFVPHVDGDDYTWDDSSDTSLTYAALVRTVYRLQNEMAGLAAQVVELREKLERWEGDS